MSANKIKFVFLGSSRFSLIVLEALERADLLPTLIITAPDQKKDRGQRVHSTLVKDWAEARKIPVETPLTLKNNPEIVAALITTKAQVFVTASYGKIIPKNILEIPKHGTLNVHPSLLPKFRGPSPLESSILELGTEKNADKNSPQNPVALTGVTIMLTDEDVDHGPIVEQKSLPIDGWPPVPPYTEQLETILARAGGTLLAEILPKWIAGEIKPVAQKHADATFTKKFTNIDGLIDLSDDAAKNLRKIRALHRSPGTYFFLKKGGDKDTRIKIKSADIKNGELMLDKIVPEGKKEMTFKDFWRGFR